MKAALLLLCLSFAEVTYAQEWVNLHNRVVNECVSSDYAIEKDEAKKEQVLGQCIWGALTKIQEDTITMINLDIIIEKAELSQTTEKKKKAKLNKELKTLQKDLRQKSNIHSKLKLLNPNHLNVGEIWWRLNRENLFRFLFQHEIS